MNPARYIKQVLKRQIYRMHSMMARYEKIVWLVGDGRSGTTWVSGLINWNNDYREYFEPFHPFTMDASFRMHHYLREEGNDSVLDSAIEDVFKGRVVHERVNRENRRLHYRRLLVKDIFANLMVSRVMRFYPNVRTVLLLRNPFAVALSKQHKKAWHWMTEPEDLLKDNALMEDYLAPFEALIRGCEDNFILKQILIWSAVHYVVFRQLPPEAVYVLFYEEIYTNPHGELPKLFSYIEAHNVSVLQPNLERKIRRFSRVSGKESTLARGKSPVDSWRDDIDAETIRKGFDILRHFGLEGLYDTEGRHHPEYAKALFRNKEENG